MTMTKRFAVIFSLVCMVSVGHAQTEDVGKLLPAVQLLLDGNTGPVIARITPSRTQCASPCTVVFSAEKTTAVGLDDHGIWSQLSYYWDFDTDESDTYGALYDQTYDYVAGDTSFEKGHVPMVTKTFLCESGTCVYNVGLRAQNAAGDHDDEFVAITVQSEAVAWGAANTVCVSNTLDTGSDWTSFDKPCPAGAIKQSVTLDRDDYDGKLVLFKKGDVFSQNIGSDIEQSNFKLGVFGDDNEDRPEIDGNIWVGFTRWSGPSNAPSAANYGGPNEPRPLTDAQLANGWPENVYVEGLKLGGFSFPMSYQHIGVHDIDMNRRAYRSGGRIDVAASATLCHGNPLVSCANVPFPKGGYISSVDIMGFAVEDFQATDPQYRGGPGVNIVQTACPMVNFLGITDTRVQRAREHNLRVAGWYRFNIMRTQFRGEHHLVGKQKITPRSCLRSGGAWESGVWATHAALPSTWNRDVEGRTRADADPTDPSLREYAHASRYQVMAYNQIGDSSAPVGISRGGVQYQTNLRGHEYPVDLLLHRDMILSHNVFEKEPGGISATSYDAQVDAQYVTCVDNDYSRNDGVGCLARSQVVNNPQNHVSIDPQPLAAPAPPQR